MPPGIIRLTVPVSIGGGAGLAVGIAVTGGGGAAGARAGWEVAKSGVGEGGLGDERREGGFVGGAHKGDYLTAVYVLQLLNEDWV